MDKLIEILISNAFGGVGILVVGWLLTKYVEQINSNINDAKQAAFERYQSVTVRVESIENKYRDVLDIILEKFSKWEDRIASLLSKMADLSPEDLKREIDLFKQESMSDISTLALEMERISLQIAQVQTEPGFDQRKLLIEKFEELKHQTEARLKNLESATDKLLKVMGLLNAKQKEHEFKIQNLIVTRSKTVIKN